MSSTPASAIGSTRSPRTARPWARAVARRSSPAALTDASPASPRPDQAEVALVRQSDRVDLERDGPSAERSGGLDRGGGVRHGRGLGHRQAGLAQQRQALAPPRARGEGRSARPGRAPAAADPSELEPVRRPIRGQRRPTRPPWPPVEPTGPRALPARDRRDRGEGLERAAQQRGAISPLVEHGLRLRWRLPGRQDTYTGRMCGRSRVAARSWRVTSFAVATSAGIDLYGKSCTSTRTS